MPNGVTYAHICATYIKILTRREAQTRSACDECDFIAVACNGIAAYTRNLADALVESNEVDISIFLRFRLVKKGAVLHPALKPLGKLVKIFVPHAYDSPFSSATAVRKGLVRYHPDIYHDPNYLSFRFDGPTVITVHDLSFVRYPETHPAIRSGP